jgi:hypothetical protein
MPSGKRPKKSARGGRVPPGRRPPSATSTAAPEPPQRPRKTRSRAPEKSAGIFSEVESLINSALDEIDRGAERLARELGLR